MKTGSLVLFLACVALAQTSGDDRVAAGCGPNGINFDVKTEPNPHRTSQPSAGQAMVYVIQDDTRFLTVKPIVRVGMDGEWVGATHGTSYMYFPVAAGEHHLCLSWQALTGVGAGTKNAALHLTAVAGTSYYFRVQDVLHREGGAAGATIDLQPLDTDEGKLLAGTYALATSQQKK